MPLAIIARSITIFRRKTADLFVYLFVDLLVLSKMWQGNEYEDGLLRGHLQQGAEVSG